jgi:hypothetical protein
MNRLKKIITYLFISFILYSFISLIVSYAYNALNIPINPLVLDCFFITLTATFFIFARDKNIFQENTILDYLIVLVLPICFYVFILFSGHNGIRFPIISSWDSAAHYSMLKTFLLNHSLLYSWQMMPPIAFNMPWFIAKTNSTFSGYTPGFYGVAGNILLNATSFFKNSKFDILSINYFYIYIASLISFSTYFIYNTLLLYAKVNKIKISIYFTFLFVLLLYLGTYFLPNLTNGFASFISAIFYFCALIYFFSQYYLLKTKSLHLEILIAMLIFLISASWFIFVPVIIGALLFFIFKKGVVSNIRFLLIISASILLSIIPIYLLLRGLSTGDISTFVNSSGGIQNYNIFLYIILFLSNIIFFRNKLHRDFLFPIFIINLLFIPFLTIIAIYQLLTSGQIGYYLLKTLLVAIIPASIPFYFLFQEEYRALDSLVKKAKKNVLIYKILLILALIVFCKLISIDSFALTSSRSLTKYEQNALYILPQLYDLKGKDITVFPDKDTFILWNGAINEHNSTFYKEWSHWFMPITETYSALNDWLKKDKSNNTHIIVDLNCLINKRQQVSLAKINKNFILWYRPGCNK